jgi:hypothetical protein
MSFLALRHGMKFMLTTAEFREAGACVGKITSRAKTRIQQRKVIELQYDKLTVSGLWFAYSQGSFIGARHAEVLL